MSGIDEATFIAAVVKDDTGERWRECRKLNPEVFEDPICRETWREVITAKDFLSAQVAGKRFAAHEVGWNYIQIRDALFIASLERLADVKEWSATLPANNSDDRFPAVETEPEEREILEDVEPIICGLLEPGDKACISSGSKSFKTWTLIQLAYAVNSGRDWLGFRTKKRRVLFLNFEIKRLNFWKRVFRVRRTMGLSKADDFVAWNLRGEGFSMDADADALIRRAKQLNAGLIILDPIYKLFGDRNESSAGDMATLMSLFDKVATATGAAIVFAHHFAKGNAAGKDANDRPSGSGVFARDPDCLITLTRLSEDEGENRFAVDVTLRDLPPVDKFAVRREHPLMVRDETANPRNLHEAGGRQAKFDLAKIVAVLPPQGLKTEQWRAASPKMARSTFNDYRRDAETADLVWKDGDFWKRKA